MLSPIRRTPSRRTITRQSYNDENVSPFRTSSETSMSLQPSEPPSSPLVSNSFLYNLPDPTLNLPRPSHPARLDIFSSPSKSSAIASLNKPLSHDQTQHLESQKAGAARVHLQPPSSVPPSPSKAHSPGSTSRTQANLDAVGGLPTPPSSSEALTTTPRASKHALAPLPGEPLSPSPSRIRGAVLSPARASPSKASRSNSTPRSTRASTRRLLPSGGANSDSDSDNDILRSRTPIRTQLLREIAEEDSDEDEEQQEEEIQLISFKRGGPDATFIREIKQNGWDQPRPPSPIKFTFLEPVVPNPRQSAVGARARSRSKTPQTRASPAPSHASSSKASNASRAKAPRSRRASSTTAAAIGGDDETRDLSDESIKSAGTILTNLSSKSSHTRSKGRVSVSRSSAPPPVAVADLTRDHPSLPDSPGDDPLLMTGPDTYIVYHDQTPSARNRSTSRMSNMANVSLSHSTPLPAPSVAAALGKRRDSGGSDVSSASRGSLYTRMTGRSVNDASVATVANEEQEEQQEDESANTVHADQVEADDDQDEAPIFMAFDGRGFASDSDEGEPEDQVPVSVEARVSLRIAEQEAEEAAISAQMADDLSLDDVSRSFADHSAEQEDSDVIMEASDSLDSSAKDIDAVSHSLDTCQHDESDDIGANDQSLAVSAQDQAFDSSAHEHGEEDVAEEQTAEASLVAQSKDASTRKQSEDFDAKDQSLDANAADHTTDLSEQEQNGELSIGEHVVDASVVDQSISARENDESEDVSMAESAAESAEDEESQDADAMKQNIVVGPDESFVDANLSNQSAEISVGDQSVDVCESIESDIAADADEDALDISSILENVGAANQSHQFMDESFTESSLGALEGDEGETSAVADVVMSSYAAQEVGDSSFVSSPAGQADESHHVVDSQTSADQGIAIAERSFQSSELDDISGEAEHSQANDVAQTADEFQAADESHHSDGAETFEHSLSVADQEAEASIIESSTSILNESHFDQNDGLNGQNHGKQLEQQASSQAPTTSTESLACNSIDFDISTMIYAANTTSDSSSAPTLVDGDLLPHPVVLIEPFQNGSIRFEAVQNEKGSNVTSERTSAEDRQSLPQNALEHLAVHSDSYTGRVQAAGDENYTIQSSDSVSSVLSSPSTFDTPQHTEEVERLRSKYQSSRVVAAERSRTFVRRFSLSTESEHDSDVGSEQSDNDEQDDEDVEELHETEQSSQRPDASQSKRARGIIDEQAEEEQDNQSEEEEDEEEQKEAESALDRDTSSGGEDEDEGEEEDEVEDEDKDEDEDEEDVSEAEEEDDDASSHLDEDEQSASQMDPVVIISSSASPSVASTASIRTSSIEASTSRRTATHAEPDNQADSESEEDEQEQEYVVEVVRDSRERAPRSSAHSVISNDEEPQIHTLHLRQPLPRHDQSHNHTLADASSSRSRVLKLGQATSTPIVEISSLDPRAAARATAILKLFHKYVDEGWILGADEMGDATESRMRRVVDAIRRADGQGRRLEDASELDQQSGVGEGTGDLTTFLMDAELSLAREGTVETESFLGSRATSVASLAMQGQRPLTESPATPFLPGGFRATPASVRAAPGTDVQQNDPPSVIAAWRPTTAGDASNIASTIGNLTKRKADATSSAGFTFRNLETPKRTSRRPAAKQARLSATLTPPSLETFNSKVWDTRDWTRLDKYFTCGVKKISSQLLSLHPLVSDKTAKARSYVDALFGVDLEEVAELFLDEMRIPDERRMAEWSSVKLEQRLKALRRKYVKKVEVKYPEALQQHGDASKGRSRSKAGGDDSMATEDLDWSLNANTTAATQQEPRATKGRVSFGTPYRMGAHSTPAAGLLKKATHRAARQRRAAQEQHEEERESLYPALPASPSTTIAVDMSRERENDGVITKASRLISRLGGSFGGLLSSPRPSTEGKGKRKATEAELETLGAATISVRRCMEQNVSAPHEDEMVDRTACSIQSVSSGSDSLVESMLNSTGITSTINGSLFTNATSIRSDITSTSSHLARSKTTTSIPTITSYQSRCRLPVGNMQTQQIVPVASTLTSTQNRHEGARRNVVRTSFGCSRQLVGGSSGVSHTPLSLLSPATHRVAARKVDELRNSRAKRNWTSPSRQLRPTSARIITAQTRARSSGTGGGGGVPIGLVQTETRGRMLINGDVVDGDGSSSTRED